jgi:probable rRNA maturation factor
MSAPNTAGSPHQLAVGYGLPRTGLPSANSFRDWMRLALGSRRKPVTIALRLVDAGEGQRLNAQFRQRDYATNVLSFPAELRPARNAPEILGDIAICAPVVLREALEQGKPARAHFAHMTIHGVLHLLGHDHVDERDARAMEALERRLLASIGVADPYQ